MGCIARLGCLVLIVILAIGGWYTKDLWLPEKYRSHVTATSRVKWQPVTAEGANRTQVALERLSQPKGQVFQTLSASDLASYAFAQFSSATGAAQNVEASVSGDVVSVRANVRLADLGGASALGPLGGMLNERETVQLSGTFSVVKPGVAEFTVKDVKVRNLTVPHGMVASLVKRLDRGTRPDGVNENAIAVPIPRYVGDIRVANGKVTLYKTTP